MAMSRIRVNPRFPTSINDLVRVLTSLWGELATAVNGRIDRTDDIIIDDNAHGLILKDNAATPHYWRVTVNSTGTLVVTDIGTTKP